MEKTVSDAAQPAATMGRRGRTPQEATATAQAERSSGVVDRRDAAPLEQPLPAVNSILVSPERRLAVLNGVIVREGDSVGSRVLIRIDPDAVVLKEPSGREVRVPIRRRVSVVVPH
jgi:hypothetical protein